MTHIPSQETLDRTLIAAARRGDAGRVEELLRLGASPHARGAMGGTALIEGAARGHLPVLRVLAPVSDLRAQDEAGHNALLYAALPAGTAAGARLLWGLMDPSAPDALGWTPLMSAACVGDEGFVARRATREACLARAPASGMSALMAAAACQQLGALAALLPLSDPWAVDAVGDGALIHALAQDPRAARMVLDVARGGAQGEPALAQISKALRVACLGGFSECARSLLEFVGPDERWESGCSALMLAAHAGSVECAEILLLAGADPTALGEGGRDAAAYARLRGNHALAAMVGERAAVAAERSVVERELGARGGASPKARSRL